jgi:hypothetical protein
VLTIETIQALAQKARIDHKTSAALVEFVARLSPELTRLAENAARRLQEEPPRTVLAATDERLGEQASLFYLLVALLEIPRAETYHRERGIDATISLATWADLSVWCHHQRKIEGRLGISLATLEWAQHALRGHLLRIGSFQVQPEAFDHPLYVFRSVATGELLAVSDESRPVDLSRGIVEERTVARPAEGWQLALQPGDPMLRMHVPANARVSFHEFASSVGDALTLFAALRPELAPKGIFGEGWIWDPQVREFLPDASRLDDVRSVCAMYPSRIREASTIRRLFGASATRASIAAAPRQGMTMLQRAIADFLADEGHTLQARGLFVLNRELLPIVERSRREQAWQERESAHGPFRQAEPRSNLECGRLQ